MKKLLIIVAIMLGLLLLAEIVFWFLGSHSAIPTTQTTATSTSVGQMPNTFSVSPTSQGASQTSNIHTMTVAARGAAGSSITINDFINNGTTAADPENRGMYYIAGAPGYCLSDGTCPHGASSSDFIVTYDASKQFFTIALTQEPIKQARLDAQDFLLSTLGVSQNQLCSLNYYLGTTISVNAIYAGTNLGFSFCPGATAL
jgi:hypothetical protein